MAERPALSQAALRTEIDFGCHISLSYDWTRNELGSVILTGTDPPVFF